MASIAFHPSAQLEYEDAVEWYQQRNPAVARRFVAEVDRVLAQIRAQPDRYGWHDDDFREAVLRRYPYRVIYRVEPSGDALIVAIAHASREPEYWRNRT